MNSSLRFSAIVRRSTLVLTTAISSMALLALLAAAPSSASAQTAVTPAAGDGLTTDTAYQITELGNLVWLHDQAAANATAGKYYMLMNDIDASDTANWNDNGTNTSVLEGFNPIGIPSGSGWPFNGVFLGGGHAITGLSIHRGIYGVGLFGSVGSDGSVIDLRLVGGTVTAGDHSVGGLVGYNQGAILQCSNTGSVDGSGSDIGDLVGYNAGGTVSRCHATGDVTGDIGSTTTDANGIGGLVGTNSGTVSQSYATGTVTTGDHNSGGLVGENNGGTVTQCHATGAVSGNENVGGLCGGSSGTVSECYATGAVSGIDSEFGGLIGENMYGTVSRCYATGAVSNGTDYVVHSNGGLVGYSFDGTISQSYATGSVHGTYAGGLLGANDGEVSQCYAIGAVTGDSLAGGLVGNGAAGVSDSYWNIETSGQSSSAGGTGLTTAQMEQSASYTVTGNVWAISGGYPYLDMLTTCTLTYKAGTGGQVGDGLTTGTTLVQVVNLASTGTPITVAPNADDKFTYWSDGYPTDTRTDSGLTTDTSVTAFFAPKNAARAWLQYR